MSPLSGAGRSSHVMATVDVKYNQGISFQVQIKSRHSIQNLVLLTFTGGRNSGPLSYGFIVVITTHSIHIASCNTEPRVTDVGGHSAVVVGLGGVNEVQDPSISGRR